MSYKTLSSDHFREIVKLIHFLDIALDVRTKRMERERPDWPIKGVYLLRLKDEITILKQEKLRRSVMTQVQEE